jgi:hypothetical protein
VIRPSSHVSVSTYYVGAETLRRGALCAAPSSRLWCLVSGIETLKPLSVRAFPASRLSVSRAETPATPMPTHPGRHRRSRAPGTNRVGLSRACTPISRPGGVSYGQRALIAADLVHLFEREAKAHSLANLKKGEAIPESANLRGREDGKSTEKAAAAMNVSASCATSKSGGLRVTCERRRHRVLCVT